MAQLPPVQSLIWTALPNGFTPDGRGLRLSVLLSPRLDPRDADPILKSFDDFVSWPATLRAARFTVRIGATTIELRASDFDGTVGTPDGAVWEALFPASTFVRGFSMPDHSASSVLSFDTVAMDTLVRDIYAKLTATAGTELPSIAELRDDDGIKAVIDGVQDIDRAFWDRKTRQRNVGMELARWRENRFKGLAGVGETLAPFQLFHTPPNRSTTRTNTPDHDKRLAVTWRTHERGELDAAKAVRELDFHQIASAMNQYPTLLRRLGLVVDFVIPHVSLALGADVPVSVTVELPRSFTPIDMLTNDVRRSSSPITRTRLTDAAFAPVPRPSPHPQDLRVANGLLRLDGEQFALLQADVDGAGHKLMNFARSLAAHADERRQVDPVTKLPRRAGAPALRNAGLMLVHRGRGRALETAFGRNKSRDAAIRQSFVQPTAPSTVLHAEDLVRGWRIDVWDRQTDKWRSLCERIADYEIGDAIRLAGLREEGTVRLAATTSTDGNNADLIHLHEAVTVWSGWSLAARPPGLAITRDEKVGDGAAEVPEGVPLRSSFVSAPGTLPRLRYGRVYAMRARAVDLAGNSLPPTTKSYPGDEAALSAATPYFRFEPVQPPGITLVGSGKSVEAPLEGESMSRVAVRSFNGQWDDATPAAGIARRWGVATRVSQREAELHGVLDGPEWATPGQFTLLATRDAELKQVTLRREPPAGGPGLELPTIQRPPVPGRTDDATEERDRGTLFAVLPADATRLPYLPDPLCTHVAARIVNHPAIGAGTIIPIPMYRPGTAWPDAAPFQIHVYEATGQVPKFDEETRTLLIPTPKSARATLRLSCMLDTDALELMGVWNWVAPGLRTPALRRRAQHGGLWPLTPWREVEIVHAVQRPLLPPTITQVQLTRPAGATWVKPGMHVLCHRGSTDRLDLHAAWHEPKDSPSFSSPTDVAKTDVPFSVKITDPQGYGGVVEHLLPDPADPNHIAFGPIKPLTGKDLRDAAGKIHDFGDTRYRRVEYHMVGTSRFREYMPPSLLTDGSAKPQPTDANITLAGPVVRDWALSSAPPPAPEVLYVVPTFGWTRGTDAAGKRTSWRRGGGIRVWLDRPWNASGYGEMLGVVLPLAGADIDPNVQPYKHAVTQWGNDPVWKSSFVQGVAPALAHFPLARTAADPTGAWLPPGAPASEADQPPGPFPTSNLRHPGLSEGTNAGRVDVAPHDVFWDAERQLWYCDIEIAHGASYFPFVRLALTRYQPAALFDAHLSSIVLADFCALAPDRWLSVSRTSDTKRQVRVFGFSHEESAGHAEAWRHRTESIHPVTKKVTVNVPTGISKTNVVDVWVEQLDPGLGEDFGWRRVADGVEAPVIGAARADARNATRARELFRKRDFTALVAESLLDLTMEWPTRWSGSVTLPSAPSASTRYRVVVAEYEEYLADGPNPYEEPLARKDRRLVFVEHVELT